MLIEYFLLRRIRDKYESELKEVEKTERETMERYNNLKAKFNELEGEHERLNANFRRQGLQQFNVRGVFKAKAVSLLHALANNIMAARRLRAVAA